MNLEGWPFELLDSKLNPEGDGDGMGGGHPG